MQKHVCVLFSWSLFALCACGGATAETGGGKTIATTTKSLAPSPPALESLLPNDTMGVMRFDLKKLRQSPYYESVFGFVQTVGEQEGQGAPVQAAMDREGVFSRTDLAIIAYAEPPQATEPSDVMMFLRGRYEDKELEKLIAAEIASQTEDGQPPPEVQTTEIRGRTAYIYEEAVATALDNHTLLMTTGPRMDAVLAAVDAGAAGLPDAPYREMAGVIGMESAPITFAVKATDVLKTLAKEDAGEFASQIEQMRGMGGRISASDGIAVDIVIQMADDRAASSLSILLERYRVQLSDNFMIGLLGLNGILDLTKATSKGDRVTVATRLSDAETQVLVGKLDNIREAVLGPQSAQPQ